LSKTAKQADVATIRLEGSIRMGEKVDKLRAAVEDNLDKGSVRLILDMSAVTALDSSGIGIMVRCLTMAKQKGGNIKLAGVPEKSIQSMTTTGVLKLFETFPDAASAAKSFE
jgi:anti-sigma B factor antagonist